jgi:hypothetical protein
MKAKSEKEKEKLEFKSLEELQNNLPPILYDADAQQIIPFLDERETQQGKISIRVAHVIDPLPDLRYFQREREFKQQSEAKNRPSGVFANSNPTELLWSELAVDRIGYKPREGWKSRVKTIDKMDVIGTLLALTPAETQQKADALDAEYLLDDDELVYLSFEKFYGGVTVGDWKEWLISGNLPENVKLDAESYPVVIEHLKRGIAPRIMLTVTFAFKPNPSNLQLDEASSMIFGTPAPNKLASASKEEKTDAERWFALYQKVCDSAEGYKDRIPAHDAVPATQMFFAKELSRLGKSER